MGYEERRGRIYHYGKKRVAGRSVSTYDGRHGQTDFLAGIHRKTLTLERLHAKGLRAELSRLERVISYATQEHRLHERAVRLLSRAMLIAGGFRLHQRHWRSVHPGRPRLTLTRTTKEGRQMDLKREQEELRRLNELVAEGASGNNLAGMLDPVEGVMNYVDAEHPTPAERTRVKRSLHMEPGLFTAVGQQMWRALNDLVGLLRSDDFGSQEEIRSAFEELVLELGWGAAEPDTRMRIQEVGLAYAEVEVFRMLRGRAVRERDQRAGYIYEQSYRSAKKQHIEAQNAYDAHMVRKQRGTPARQAA